MKTLTGFLKQNPLKQRGEGNPIPYFQQEELSLLVFPMFIHF